MKKTNFHTHTSLCKHAEGTVKDMVNAAKLSGFDVIGISDHSPLPKDHWPEFRMNFSDFPSYISMIRDEKEKSKNMIVLAGAECDHSLEFVSFYKDYLLGEHGLDYLIGSVHLFPYKGEWRGTYGGVTTQDHLKAYTDHAVEMINQDVYDFIAHPDLFVNSYLEWDDTAVDCSRQILKAAEQNAMPLEINGFGIRKGNVNTSKGSRPMYPHKEFWSLAKEYKIHVIISSDAHKPEDIAANLDDCMAIAREFGLSVLEDPRKGIGTVLVRK